MRQLSAANDTSISVGPKTLLVAYDFFDASDAALNWGIEIAKAFRSKIIILCIDSPSRLEDQMDGGLPGAQARVEMQGNMQSLRKRLEGAGVRFEVIHRAGIIADIVIQEACAQRADLVLMGAYGSRRLDPPRLGSTAEAMIRAMSCAVFVMGPESLAQPPRLDTVRKIRYLKVGDHATARWVLLEQIAERSRAVIEIECLVDGGSSCDPSRHQRIQADCEHLVNALRAQHLRVNWDLQYGGEDVLLHSISGSALVGLTAIDADEATTRAGRRLNIVIQNSRCPVLILPHDRKLSRIFGSEEVLAASSAS
ncbi:MAG: universal stress protein [Acidobacteriota bacterium]